MGAFDDALKNAVPGGNLATPIAVAAGALILGKIFGGGSSPSPGTAATRPSTAPSPTAAPAGDILGRSRQPDRQAHGRGRRAAG